MPCILFLQHNSGGFRGGFQGVEPSHSHPPHPYIPAQKATLAPVYQSFMIYFIIFSFPLESFPVHYFCIIPWSLTIYVFIRTLYGIVSIYKGHSHTIYFSIWKEAIRLPHLPAHYFFMKMLKLIFMVVVRRGLWVMGGHRGNTTIRVISVSMGLISQ